MRLRVWTLFVVVWSLMTAFAYAVIVQDQPMVQGESRQVGKYRVSLRLPDGGLVAGEEQQIEFRVVNTSRADPVLGPAAVIRAAIEAVVTMPVMPSMPKLVEVPHPEGVPGDYGLHPTFAHGGEYLLTLNIVPPADDPFTVELPLKVLDGLPNRKPRIHPYSVRLETQPGRVQSGQPTRLHLTVWSNRETRDAEGRPTGKRQLEAVRSFDVAHEKQMHLIIVRGDLAFFAHEHPEPQPDGTFVVSGFTFPTAGEYRLFAETAPKGAGSQVLSATLKVSGRPEFNSRTPAAVDHAVERTVAGVRIALNDGAVLTPRKTASFRVAFRDSATGAPVTDLQPYLGMLGHMIMIHEDAATFVHAHTDERDAQNGKQGLLTFLVRPPKPGRYRMWMEFQRNGIVNRAEFTVEAKEAGSE